MERTFSTVSTNEVWGVGVLISGFGPGRNSFLVHVGICAAPGRERNGPRYIATRGRPETVGRCALDRLYFKATQNLILLNLGTEPPHKLVCAVEASAGEVQSMHR